MNCTTTCNNCNKCDDKCPYCGYKGKEVKLETVAELTKNKCVFFENGEKIYICTNKKCDLVYFQVGNLLSDLCLTNLIYIFLSNYFH